MNGVTQLTGEQRELLARTEKLAAEVLAPLAADGRPGEINRPLLAALAEHRLLPQLFDSGISAMRLCLLREALARHCTEAETALAVQGLGAFPILQAGRPEVVDEWLPRLSAGDAAAAFALTEPDA